MSALAIIPQCMKLQPSKQCMDELLMPIIVISSVLCEVKICELVLNIMQAQFVYVLILLFMYIIRFSVYEKKNLKDESILFLIHFMLAY